MNFHEMFLGERFGTLQDCTGAGISAAHFVFFFTGKGHDPKCKHLVHLCGGSLAAVALDLVKAFRCIRVCGDFTCIGLRKQFRTFGNRSAASDIERRQITRHRRSQTDDGTLRHAAKGPQVLARACSRSHD